MVLLKAGYKDLLKADRLEKGERKKKRKRRRRDYAGQINRPCSVISGFGILSP